jgi:hypothetical protein
MLKDMRFLLCEHFFPENAVGRQCGISPEFPTGNGRVDMHLRCKDRQAVIEVKSFKSHGELEYSKEQAVKYAKRLGFFTTKNCWD